MVAMDEAAVLAAVKKILQRGNDAVIRRKGGAVVVLEEHRAIKYDPQRIGAE